MTAALDFSTRNSRNLQSSSVAVNLSLDARVALNHSGNMPVLGLGIMESSGRIGGHVLIFVIFMATVMARMKDVLSELDYSTAPFG